MMSTLSRTAASWTAKLQLSEGHGKGTGLCLKSLLRAFRVPCKHVRNAVQLISNEICNPLDS